MEKCKECKLEMTISKVVKEVVDKEEFIKKVYICRNPKCSMYKKELIL